MPDALTLLLPIGLLIGFLGSLGGVGGGFLIVPLLLLSGSFFRAAGFSPEMATGTSLCLVVLTSLSANSVGVWGKRIDYRTGALFALASLPGAFGGRFLIKLIPADSYVMVFSLFLFFVAVYFAFTRRKPGSPMIAGKPRELKERTGEHHRFEVHMPIGLVISFFVGFLSSLFGVGGGIINVPVMVLIFGMPGHIATATSQFVIFFTSLVGASEASFHSQVEWPVVLWMGVGVVLGAQVGMRVAKKVSERGMRLLLGGILALGAIALFVRTI
ncbi:MAG: sulfite exporter TauE/SafE family protein [Planctomycetota bacterium]|nr:sulfite exporter TauE/SafE family protein [Planctomycetota bacterium]